MTSKTASAIKESTSTFSCAVLFSDIVSSSMLFKALGNNAAKGKIDRWIKIMLDIVGMQKGHLIKTIGDEIMVWFETLDSACTCAIALNVAANEQGFRLRTGTTYGHVIRDKNDLFGDTVNNAAFLTHAARAEEILIDGSSAEQLPRHLYMHCEHYDSLVLKGQEHAVDIQRLNWQATKGVALDQTIVSSASREAETRVLKLVIYYNGESYHFDLGSSSLSMGRDGNNNDICVEHECVSRNHCQIVFNRGKYVLEDHSANGTYILPKDEHEVYLRRESAPLLSEGSISLGLSHKQNKINLNYSIIASGGPAITKDHTG